MILNIRRMRYSVFLLFWCCYCFGQSHLNTKCPYDATYIKNTGNKIVDSNTDEIKIEFVCGGIYKHKFFVRDLKKTGKTGLDNIADKIMANLPKPRENATLQELALYNRIMILLTWLTLQSSDNL